MSHLHELENRSIYLIREAYERYGSDGMAMLWSMGKDSTTLMWLVRKAFLGKVPFPIVHIDTSFKFPEMYAYRDKMAKAWGLDVKVVKNTEALADGMRNEVGKTLCCNALKTEPFKRVVGDLGLSAVLLAIRRDEHGVRAKERYVSPRDGEFRWNYKDQPLELWGQFAAASSEGGEHVRVHPMLDWTELDVWEYIQQEEIPVIGMYFAKEGRRYRSIGCLPCTAPVESQAKNVAAIIAELKTTNVPERAGRAQDKEHTDAMQKLRALGYM